MLVVYFILIFRALQTQKALFTEGFSVIPAEFPQYILK